MKDKELEVRVDEFLKDKRITDTGLATEMFYENLTAEDTRLSTNAIKYTVGVITALVLGYLTRDIPAARYIAILSAFGFGAFAASNSLRWIINGFTLPDQDKVRSCIQRRILYNVYG